MKTRIIYPTMWDQDRVLELSKDAKVLLFNLLTTGSLGLTRYLRVSEKHLLLETGLNRSELEKARHELTSCDIHWKDGWFYLGCDFAYVDYEGRDRVMVAKDKELSVVPAEILTHFKEVSKGLKTGYEPVLNPKSKTINKGGVGGDAKFATTASLTAEQLDRIAREKRVSRREVDLVFDQLKGWRDAHKVKDWNLTLQAWIARGIQKGDIRQIDPASVPIKPSYEEKERPQVSDTVRAEVQARMQSLRDKMSM